MSSVLERSFSRREVLSLASVGAVGLAGGTYTFNLYRSTFFDKLQVTEYNLKTPRWSADMKPLKIAFLSDLHVGSKAVTLEKVSAIVEQTNALNADIILLGGDFLTNPGAGAFFYDTVSPTEIAKALRPLKARYGVHAVLGNHDWSVDGKGMWKALEANGIKVLENDFTLIPHGKKGFYLIGLADYLTRKPLYRETIDAIDGDIPRIVLAHDPYVFKDMPHGPVIQLSGHTHGGQVSLPLIGPVINPTPGAPLRWLYGIIEENGNRMLITSGIGTSSLPVKNTPCEIVLLTIETSATLTS